MKSYIVLLLLSSLLVACNQPSDTVVEKEENMDEKEAPVFSATGKQSTVYTTASDTDLRLAKTGEFSFEAAAQPLENEVSVFVNPEKSFQTFIGIGGAITDASAEVFAKLPEDKQQELLDAYYDVEKGIGYSLCRTPIHSCDFSSASYTYIEEGDAELETFSIAHDQEFKIPLIKKAIATAGGELMLYASPWSPPAFMKSNKDMLQGGKLLPEYFDAWALYYTKFISLCLPCFKNLLIFTLLWPWCWWMIVYYCFIIVWWLYYIKFLQFLKFCTSWCSVV